MKAKVVTLENKAAGELTLSEAIFGLPERKDILHRVVNWQLAKRRAGTHLVKGRSDVSGSKKKPFKQKGTGRARRGTMYATQHRGGGIVMGPSVRSHAIDLPKKIRTLGLKTALSVKQAAGELIVIKEAVLGVPKTAELAKYLAALGLTSALIVDGVEINENFKKAVLNLKGIDVIPVQGVNVYDILRHKKLVLTEAAIQKLEERLV
jgi:large subunit ribosomal protein L4